MYSPEEGHLREKRDEGQPSKRKEESTVEGQKSLREPKAKDTLGGRRVR
jgi:hypothetical protein